jgi:DNA-binding CsgD family transcriptional regulator
MLSAREAQVLQLVGQGLSNAEIASRLGVSRHTVVTQIASASAKLGANNRAHAASLAADLDADLAADGQPSSLP